ncbi:MAG: DUF1759 domain-containing protein, partial [Gammaproteobacteria bacterium]|nr:DUF1759 domain-containing protein [Gammaproteobacteria bacterium]
MDPLKSKNENLQALTQLKYEILPLIEKMDKAVTLLHTKNDEWDALLQSLETESQVRENELYTKNAEGEDGFIQVMLSGEDVMIELRNRVAEIDHAISTLEAGESKTPSVSTGISQPESLEGDHGAAPDTSRDVEPTPPIQLPATQPAVTPSNPLPVSNRTEFTRLPEIVLPTFSGDKAQFKSFWNLFSSSIDRRNISASEKFVYLRGLLSGKAAKLIDGFDPMDINYPEAVALLHKRYSDDRNNKQRLYHELDQIPQSSQRFENLEDTVDPIDRILR